MVSQVASVEEAQANEESPGVADAQNIGSRLRAVRRQMQLSLHAVETLSDRTFKSSALGAYERGERNISIPRLKQLARLYDLPLDQLLPHDVTGVEPAGSNKAATDHSGAADRAAAHDDGSPKITIDLTKLNSVTGPEREPLRRFLSMIQLKRQDFNSKRITIRIGDLHAIAYLFGVAPEAMVHRLGKLGLLVRS
jgi:transcriptional regulator with XRE-family HTH domain